MFVILMSLAQKVKELKIPFVKRPQRDLRTSIESYDFGLGPYVFPGIFI
jgi:hypothetical protein